MIVKWAGPVDLLGPALLLLQYKGWAWPKPGQANPVRLTP